MKRILALLAVVIMVSGARADVRLPTMFSDNMVVQRETSATFWGWAQPGEKISVTASWGATASATAGEDGTWKLKLKTPKAGGPFTITIKGQNTIELKNILSGEVWLCSGQSNMGMTVNGVNNAQEEIAAANYPQIRLLSVNLTTANEPQKECKVRGWEVCASNNVGSFTAAGYFFGRKLYKDLNVPIGLINSSWGGTCIEAWTSWDVQKDDPAMQSLKKSWDERDKTYTSEADQKQFEADKKALAAWNKGDKKTNAPRPRLQGQPHKSQNYPANLFNAMINPLVPFAIKGAIWYQGEGNSGRGKEYRGQMERLIVNWRTQWGYEFPFYFVQLPNFMAPWQSPVEDGGWPQIRESFAKTAKEVPNTGMAITIDIGEEKDIHPKNKQDVGDRLGRVALHQTYGLKGFAWSGPVAESCKFEGGKAVIRFNNGGAPLAVKGGGKIVGFALTGADGLTVHADAVIEGKDTAVVSSPKVAQPVVVHYAWANNPVGVNLANAEGLPASPFRFGEMPKFTVLAKLLPDEARAYKLLYSFDPLAGKLTDGGNRFVYDTDNSAQLKGPFKKVAYFLALKDRAGAVSYAFVAMDPFSPDAAKLGVPTVASGARFQQKVTGVTVKTNAKGVTAGEFSEGCNIEFWPSNYGSQNTAKIPNAEEQVYDFGDSVEAKGGAGYGSMQIHNWQGKHSIICFNRFGGGHTCDLGLGNSEGKTRDWTFTSSGQNYSQAEFLVLVLP
ncbi:MAG: 9-O-acetylesterase [Kiritimatiellaeota bacterium]|nr:9-O-acetylesterase [Kiritimatiellota bacterium]